MYAVALLRYRKPLEQVLTIVEEHRIYLQTLQKKGWLLASGPLIPRNGGFLLLKIPDHQPEILDQIREEDPFTQKSMAQYEIWPWIPTLGMHFLDQISTQLKESLQ